MKYKILWTMVFIAFVLPCFGQQKDNYPPIRRDVKGFYDLLRESIAKEQGKRYSVLKLLPVPTDSRKFYSNDRDGMTVGDVNNSAVLKALYEYDPLDSNYLAIQVDAQLLALGLAPYLGGGGGGIETDTRLNFHSINGCDIRFQIYDDISNTNTGIFVDIPEIACASGIQFDNTGCPNISATNLEAAICELANQMTEVESIFINGTQDSLCIKEGSTVICIAGSELAQFFTGTTDTDVSIFEINDTKDSLCIVENGKVFCTSILDIFETTPAQQAIKNLLRVDSSFSSTNCLTVTPLVQGNGSYNFAFNLDYACIKSNLNVENNNIIVNVCGTPTAPVPNGNQIAIDTCSNPNLIYNVVGGNYVLASLQPCPTGQIRIGENCVDTASILQQDIVCKTIFDTATVDTRLRKLVFEDCFVNGIFLSRDTILNECLNCVQDISHNVGVEGVSINNDTSSLTINTLSQEILSGLDGSQELAIDDNGVTKRIRLDTFLNYINPVLQKENDTTFYWTSVIDKDNDGQPDTNRIIISTVTIDGGGGTTYTASNGIQIISDDIQLGNTSTSSGAADFTRNSYMNLVGNEMRFLGTAENNILEIDGTAGTIAMGTTANSGRKLNIQSDDVLATNYQIYSANSSGAGWFTVNNDGGIGVNRVNNAVTRKIYIGLDNETQSAIETVNGVTNTSRFNGFNINGNFNTPDTRGINVSIGNSSTTGQSQAFSATMNNNNTPNVNGFNASLNNNNATTIRGFRADILANNNANNAYGFFAGVNNSNISSSARGAWISLSGNNTSVPTIGIQIDGNSSSTTQSAIITSLNSGPVSLGTTSPDYSLRLHVVGDAGKTAGGTTWTTISDARTKGNIKNYKADFSEIPVLADAVRTFQYKKDYIEKGELNNSNVLEDTVNRGFVAQELEALGLSRFVKTGKDKDKIKKVNTDELIYILLQSNADLRKRVKKLENNK